MNGNVLQIFEVTFFWGGREEYRLRNNSGYNEHIEDLKTSIRKRRLKFFDHMKIINRNRLNRVVFNMVMILKNIKEYPKLTKEEADQRGRLSSRE